MAVLIELLYLREGAVPLECEVVLSHGILFLVLGAADDVIRLKGHYLTNVL